MITVHSSTLTQLVVDNLTKGGKDWRCRQCVLLLWHMGAPETARSNKGKHVGDTQ